MYRERKLYQKCNLVSFLKNVIFISELTVDILNNHIQICKYHLNKM